MIIEEDEETDTVELNSDIVDITITLKTAKIIKEPRTDSWSSVKLEFRETLIGMSQACEMLEDNTFEYFYSAHLQCSINDFSKINDIISKPLILTVLEYIKKGKEDKTTPLCISSIDMMTWILNSELKQTYLYTLFFIDPQKKTLIPPEIEIDVSFSKPLLASDFFQTRNIVQLTMEGCFALPDSLISSERDSFVAGFNFPLHGEVEEPLLFMNGKFENLPLNESRNIQWHEPSPLVIGNAIYIPNSELRTDDYIEDFGDFQEKEHCDHRKISENKSHINWNTEYRSLLTEEALTKLKQNIREHQFLPIEFIRITGPSPKVKKEDEGKLSCYGVAYVNLAPLVFPGVTEVHGAYQLHPFSKSDIEKKIKLESSLTQLVTPVLWSTLNKNNSINKESSEKVKGPPPKQILKITSPQVSAEETYLNAIIESDKFEENKTYITFNFKLQSPLVAKRTIEDINLRIGEILPVRTSFHPRPNLAAKAVEGFGTQVINTAALLLEEYKNVLQKEGTAFVGRDKHSTQDYRKSKFLYEIKKSGKYSACKEQLKYHVVKIVREKFMRKKTFATKQEFQDFICQLYTYLIEIMHKHLNEYLSMSDFIPSPTSLPDFIQLKNFAYDALYLGHLDLSKNYHQQRIARYGDNSESWIDYAVYCFAVDEDEKAVECLREALVNMPENIVALQLSGIANDMTGYSADAETFLLAAVITSPTYFLPYALLGLYYQNSGELSGATVNFKKASRLLKSSSIINVQSASPTEISAFSSYKVTSSSIYLKAAEFCLDHYVLIYAEKSLAIERTIKQNEFSPSYYYLLAKMYYLKGLYDEASSTIGEVINTIHVDADIWSLHGHILYALKNFTNAKRSYHRSVSTIKLPNDLQIVYIKLASIYMDLQELDELVDAEEALSEANILDNTHAEVWAYLTLVCLKTGQAEAAEQCYRFTCKCSLENEDLMEEIQDLSEALKINVKLI